MRSGSRVVLEMDLSTNNTLIICVDVLLLVMFMHNMIQKPCSLTTRHNRLSCLRVASAALNGCLALLYFCQGTWNLLEMPRNSQHILPLHQWITVFVQGFTWFCVGVIVSLKGRHFRKAPARVLSVSTVITAGVIGVLSLFYATLNKRVSLKAVLDVLSFFGAILLLLCTYKEENNEILVSQGISYTILNGETDESANKDCSDPVNSPFAKAGFLGIMSFRWLNSLMKKGREKPLEESDIPSLRDSDRAEVCFLQFMDQLNKQKHSDQFSQPSILRAIVLCYWKEILVSGFFAFVKIATLSTGPLILNAFVKAAEGNGKFKYEGYILAGLLFLSKTLECLSQRQWYFRSRIIGLKLKSLLTASIYRKQLRISNPARMVHSCGEIMNYVTVDAYRIGEFPFWFHHIWTMILQLSFALFILFYVIGFATIASLAVVILTVLCNTPIAKLQHKFQTKLMIAQDARLKAIIEALVNIKVLKLYAWETYFKSVIESLREDEYGWLKAVHLRRAYNAILFYSSPLLVSAATFGACYFLKIPLNASNVFTFVATLRLVQDPILSIPDLISVVIQASVAYSRIASFLEAPELQGQNVRKKSEIAGTVSHVIVMKSINLSWEENSPKPMLRDISLNVRQGEKVAICGEVGSGKSTLLAAVLGEVPNVEGAVHAFGKIAYVSQTAWIQTGTIRENILFGSIMDEQRYREALDRCSLLKDLELLPSGDMTEIGERGVNLSGGQKQRVQLARALYKDADVYLLDDPFSAVDAHTATSLFNEYVMEALSSKTVLLVTHQVEFLPAFDYILLMSDGKILRSDPYPELVSSCPEFLALVNVHRETAGGDESIQHAVKPVQQHNDSAQMEIKQSGVEKLNKPPYRDQLIKQEEREVGDTGLKPYTNYMKQNNGRGYLFFFIAALSQLVFVVGQIIQNFWLAANVDNHHVTIIKLIVVYLVIGFFSLLFLLVRCLSMVALGLHSSRSLFSQLLNSLFCAPMSFYDSTPLGRILTRVSSDLSIVDLDVPFRLVLAVSVSIVVYANLCVLAIITWQVLFVSVPVVYLAIRLQTYYLATAKELMRINGTTKSLVANHLAESVAGAITIRAFEEEGRFFSKNLQLIDTNATPSFHSFAADEWLIQRLEMLSAVVLSSVALCVALLPPETFSSGFIGMALAYGLSLSMSLVTSIQHQCVLANYIVSVERLNQYTHLPSESPQVIKEKRPPQNWPAVGKVEIQNLQIRYRLDAPLVLRGISCTFLGGNRIGIVGRTGSGKSTLIGALFRLVEPARGKILVDGVDIGSIGLHDLRSSFGIIPQDPTLFNGTVRFNLDPLQKYTDEELWEVLGKCQLREVVHEKEKGLNSLVMEDGSNWSMGQRQLFCLGRALLRKSRVLVLDEATASIDNATDMILQKTIRSEFADCTVITVAHRIPTVMDCTRVLAISDGIMVEYDEPMKLMQTEGSLFGQLVKEYWSNIIPSAPAGFH